MRPSVRTLGALSIVLVALLARLIAIAHWGNDDLRKTYDEIEYFVLAQNLELHETFSYGAPRRWVDHASLEAPGPFEPTAARPPAYPAMIAALWRGDEPPTRAAAPPAHDSKDIAAAPRPPQTPAASS